MTTRGQRRDKHIVDRDRQEVSTMYLKGYSSRQIANAISERHSPYSVSYVTVSKDVKWLLKEWLKNTITDIDQLKARELEKLNVLEQTYWIAWEKSIEDYQKKSKSMKGAISEGNSGKPNYQEVSTIDMISMGNPAYLAGIERCIERRCKILGVEAPHKVDHTSKGEQIKAITSVEIVHITKEELDERNKDAGDPSVRPGQGSLQHRPI